MAYNLQINIEQHNINFNCKYEKLDGKVEKPTVIAKAPNGNVVRERNFYKDEMILTQAEAKEQNKPCMEKRWVDDAGNLYSKQELVFEYNGEPVSEVSQTKVMQIICFEELNRYTDRYVIDKYYEIFPSDDGMKKDIDRTVSLNRNLMQMRKLWEYLRTNEVVARGELCTSSRGFVASDGYIRAVSFYNGKIELWGLEIGIFREEKVFSHLNDSVPTSMPTMATIQPTKRLKMV